MNNTTDNNAHGVPLHRLVRLSVTLTKAEAEVFFQMLAMSTGEPTDADFNELMEIERKFHAARKPNVKGLGTRYRGARLREEGKESSDGSQARHGG